MGLNSETPVKWQQNKNATHPATLMMISLSMALFKFIKISNKNITNAIENKAGIMRKKNFFKMPLDPSNRSFIVI